MRAPKTLKLADAAAVKAAGLEAIARGDREFDLSDLVDPDSSAVAVLVGWQRAAKEANTGPIRFSGAQPVLISLAQLYGVDTALFGTTPHPG